MSDGSQRSRIVAFHAGFPVGPATWIGSYESADDAEKAMPAAVKDGRVKLYELREVMPSG